jgi:hypothetical protein
MKELRKDKRVLGIAYPDVVLKLASLGHKA